MKSKQTLIKRKLLKLLETFGVWIYCEAQSGSVYLKFKDPMLRSIRIADHKGIKKYRYKWNVIIGGETHTELDRGIQRHFYSEHDLNKLKDDIALYQFELSLERKPKWKSNPYPPSYLQPHS